LLLSGCTTLGYYAQAVVGHLDLLGRRQDMQALIADAATPARLRVKLELALQMRDFASRELGLPDNGSYRSYAGLERQALVWSVVATPAFSLEPRQWCYPIIGCASYRGYFSSSAAAEYAQALEADGFDVAVEPVPAYSSLGWFADPLPSTVIDWPETELAGLIFHELAHQQLYVADDSAFNEAFATSVERVGVQRWLRYRADDRQAERWAALQQRKESFVALLLQTRRRLQLLYRLPLEQPDMATRKAAEFARLTREYRVLKQGWGREADFDAWFERGSLNNARLASVATYRELLPGFLALLEGAGDDLPGFYAACRSLAAAPLQQRHEVLRALAGPQAGLRRVK
jgi:predicted aminopeptidase